MNRKIHLIAIQPREKKGILTRLRSIQFRRLVLSKCTEPVKNKTKQNPYTRNLPTCTCTYMKIAHQGRVNIQYVHGFNRGADVF